MKKEEIEKAKFGNRLQIEFFVDKDLEALYIAPLLIQPLLENAIQHGALKRESQGWVKGSIHRIDDKVRVEIEDNGPGLSSKIIEFLLKRKEYKDPEKRIGVSNVVYRLYLDYGEKLHIKSMPYESVKFWFEIPIDKLVDKRDN